MKPPRLFKINQRVHGYQQCRACDKWKHCLMFFHEGLLWVLCNFDYADYWENTDKILGDYRAY